MSNLNPLTNYLNVPSHDKVTNTHSINSGYSGGTSKLNNYLWSESEDVTNEESIKVSDLITKEKQVLNPHTIFQDIRFKAHQLRSSNDIEEINRDNKSPEDKHSNRDFRSHGDILDENHREQNERVHGPKFKDVEYRKITTYLGEDISDATTEMEKDIKALQVKSAFRNGFNPQ